MIHENLGWISKDIHWMKKSKPKMGHIVWFHLYITFDMISQKWREDYGSQGTGEKGLWLY